MKLFGSKTSPYVRKVCVYLEETGLTYEFVESDAWQPSARLLAAAPLGKIPVLEREDGGVLFESLLIIEYLDCQCAETTRLIARDGDERWITLRWHALADGIIDATVARLLELRRPEMLQMRDKMQWEEARIARALDAIENGLDGQPFLGGNRLTLADLMLGVALQYIDFRYPHDWRSTAPRLTAWSRRIHQRPSFLKTQPPGFTPLV
jgi:glutathione S-transferase